jgi:glycerol uptake facilitator-like aquaporin
MISIFVFEMLGTGVLCGAADLIGTITTNGGTTVSAENLVLIMSIIYFTLLLICTPISGGHLNPAYTLSVFMLCSKKKEKLGKMSLMMLG